METAIRTPGSSQMAPRRCRRGGGPRRPPSPHALGLSLHTRVPRVGAAVPVAPRWNGRAAVHETAAAPLRGVGRRVLPAVGPQRAAVDVVGIRQRGDRQQPRPAPPARRVGTHGLEVRRGSPPPPPSPAEGSLDRACAGILAREVAVVAPRPLKRLLLQHVLHRRWRHDRRHRPRQLQSTRLVIESWWVSTPLASAGELRPRRLNNWPF
jgi:hypothetical protein